MSRILDSYFMMAMQVLKLSSQDLHCPTMRQKCVYPLLCPSCKVTKTISCPQCYRRIKRHCEECQHDTQLFFSREHEFLDSLSDILRVDVDEIKSRAGYSNGTHSG